MMEMQKVLEQRRSIRKYQDKPIKKEVVEELLHAALLAPTWKNSQTGRYYVVMDKDKLEQVKKEGLAPFNAENTKDAPVLIVTTFVKDRSGYERNGEPSNELFYPQLGVKLCSMAGGGVQKIYMVLLREPSRRDRSGSDLFHLRDGFEIKMNFDRNVSCFIFINALMHDDFFD